MRYVIWPRWVADAMNNVVVFFLDDCNFSVALCQEWAGHNPLVTNKQSSTSMWAGLSVMNESALLQGGGWVGFEECFSKIVLLQMGQAIGTVQRYLFVQYPRSDTFNSTDYFVGEQLKPSEEVVLGNSFLPLVHLGCMWMKCEIQLII